MGLATARILGRSHTVMLADIGQDRLDAARAELDGLGIKAESMHCDVTDRSAVAAVFERAARIGPIAAVVHTAGLSPQMSDARTILTVNALGTVNVTQAVLPHAHAGLRLVNVASMAAHLMPGAILPRRAYPLAETDPDAFVAKVMRRVNLAPKSQRPGMAYPISKNFVVWYAKHMAAAFGARDAGIVSVSPGSIDTDMGRLEADHGAAEMLKFAAIKRFGTVEEIADVLAFCASENARYLTGTDVLCDGGVVAGVRRRDLLTIKH
jgi:NAD(P)-dependent dehydrogenase (short-subunit alcohol dehydrogenase family)